MRFGAALSACPEGAILHYSAFHDIEHKKMFHSDHGIIDCYEGLKGEVRETHGVTQASLSLRARACATRTQLTISNRHQRLRH
jgi:hypothetical protein